MIETIRAESAEVDVDVLGPTSTAVNLSEWKSDHHLSSQPLVVDHHHCCEALSEMLTTRPFYVMRSNLMTPSPHVLFVSRYVFLFLENIHGV